MKVAASITPCRHDAGPTVLDERRQASARVPATNGGDVVGTDRSRCPSNPQEGSGLGD
jgi:hypothetical protein